LKLVRSGKFKANIFFLVLRFYELPTVGTIIHELISPLIYLRLECFNGDQYAIHYGYDQGILASQFYNITSAFIRSVYVYITLTGFFNTGDISLPFNNKKGKYKQQEK
jgi:hypothetical protein